jgi:uncharacterized iron-regulated protein
MQQEWKKQNNKKFVAENVQEKGGRIINCNLKREHIMPVYTISKPLELEEERNKKKGNSR